MVDIAGQEMVDIVDRNDRVLYQCSRAEMRKSVLRHRAVFIAVISSSGQILIHQRSMDKDLWPGWWDLAVGGVVASGETYDDAARRELDEEVGISPESINFLGTGLYDDPDVSLIGHCYWVAHDGPFYLRDGEVTRTEWASWKDLQRLDDVRPFLPDSRALLLPLLTDKFTR